MLPPVAAWLCWGRWGACGSAGPSVGAVSSSREPVRFLIAPATWNTSVQVLAGNSCSAAVTRGLWRHGPLQDHKMILWLLEQRGKGTTLSGGVEPSLTGPHKGFANAGGLAYVQVQNRQGRHQSVLFLPCACKWRENIFINSLSHISGVVPDTAWWMQ